MVDLINPFSALQTSRSTPQPQTDTSPRDSRRDPSQSDVPDELKGRVIYDTVELSDGVKQVNLARGFDLAEQARQEKDPEKLRDLLATGQEDISRISQLFREVFKEIQSAFSALRR